MIPVRAAFLALIAVSTLLVPDRQGGASAAPQPVPALESARRRWERFSPEEKERAKERYERFLAMSEEEREQLIESARRLRERTERVQGELAGKDAQRLSTLEPEKRRALVREIVADESRAVGARLRGQFPEDVLARLEKARPEDRARYFRRFRIQQRDRVARYAIGELGKRLALPADEIRRMQELPGDARCEAVLDLRKRLSALDVEVSGLPPGITREKWDAWLALPPEEFFEVFQRYHESRVFAQSKSAPPSPEALRALFEASRPRPGEVVALADLPAEERRARIEADRRERCTKALREGNLLPPAELEALDRKTHAEFFDTVRRVLWNSGHPPWSRRLGGPLAR
jgi:hypothetical protein